MRIVALIGARAGSSLKDKNILPLAGHPLLAWSIRAAAQVPQISMVLVSTDSPDYADTARDYGAATLMRPPELATDESPDSEFIFHALAHMNPRPDLIVHLRPTTPLRDPAVIFRALRELNPDATALRSVHRMPESAWKSVLYGTKWMTTLGGARDMDAANNPRQQFPATASPNGYVDILRTDFMEKRGLLHGDRVQPFETAPITELDTWADYDALKREVSSNVDVTRKLFGNIAWHYERPTA